MGSGSSPRRGPRPGRRRIRQSSKPSLRTLVGFSLLLALTVTPAAFTSPGGAAQPSARARAGDLIDPKLGINPTFTVWTGTIHVIKNVKSHGVSADGTTTTDNQATV